MDKHFSTTTDVKSNLPLLLGILTWYRTSIQVLNSVLYPYRTIKP